MRRWLLGGCERAGYVKLSTCSQPPGRHWHWPFHVMTVRMTPVPPGRLRALYECDVLSMLAAFRETLAVIPACDDLPMLPVPPGRLREKRFLR
jgi:hypothetical protein